MKMIRLFRGTVVSLALITGLTAYWSVALAQCLTPPPGLVGWWPGDGSVQDIVGHHDGILRGGATANAPGYVGQAFGFDGTNDYVEIPDSPAFHLTNLSVEVWVRFDTYQVPGTSAYTNQQYIVFKQNSAAFEFEGFALTKDHDPQGDVFLWEVASPGGVLIRIDSVNTVVTGAWYHVVGVRGPDYVKLYMNGHLEAQTNVDFPQDYGSNPLYFGTSGQAYYDRRLHGQLDEVSLYNRALSAAEVSALYAAGRSGKCKGAEPNPASAPIAGVYHGLFSESGGARQESSGDLTLRITSRKTWSGQMRLGGRRYSMKGQFDTNGVTQATISRRQQSPLTLTVEPVTNGLIQHLAGTVTDGAWVANVTAYRAPFTAQNPSPQAGRYTLAIAGSPDPALGPQGHGFGTARVDKLGHAFFVGRLADGTGLAQNGWLSGDGRWPFYAPLYALRGSLLGLLAFNDQPEVDLTGHLNWIRTATTTTTRAYGNGFNIQAEVLGSHYSAPPRGTRILNLTNATLTLTGGNLASELVIPFQLGANNRVTRPGLDTLRLAFSPGTGTFQGRVMEPGGRSLAFRGVVLQRQNSGFGYFLDAGQSGAVLLGP